MSVSSSMSVNSAKSKVDFRVFDRLKQDSEDIDMALDDFLSERNYTIESQVQAKLKYEADIRALDEMNMAIEGANNDNINYDEYDNPDFEFEDAQELPPVRRRKRDDPNAIFEQAMNNEGKKPMPSFHEKIKIREQLLKFFDESRLQELQLVSY